MHVSVRSETQEQQRPSASVHGSDRKQPLAMLSWIDAYLYENFSVKQQSPTPFKNIDAILNEKVSMGNGKYCFLVGPATIAYFRTVAMLSVFPNASVADNWGTGRVTAYYNTVLGELTAYDEMEVCTEIPP